MQVTVSIVNYNTKTLLDQCLNSLQKNANVAQLEIIVIDNKSHDGSVPMLKSKYPQVKLIQNYSNQGFSKANNQAIKAATSEYVLLLNSDTIVKPRAIEQLCDFMKNNPDVDMVGPRLLNDDGSIQPSISKLPNLWYVFLN